MFPKGPKAKRDAAASPETDLGVLVELARSELGFVRREVAANPSTPPSALRGLQPASLDDPIDKEIALALAGNPNTAADILDELCCLLAPVLDRDRSNRMGVNVGVALACNPLTPVEALSGLLEPTRTSTQFRKVIARETNRRDVLALLLTDRSEKVRRRAEQNQPR